MKLSQHNKTDLLEIAIILAMFFLIIVIYVPVAIWEEEARMIAISSRSVLLC